MNILPEVINHYNIYNDAKRLIGVSGEVELPELEAGCLVRLRTLSRGSFHP